MQSSKGVSRHIEIPTRDGRTHLRGQVDLPAGDDAARFPAVLIVNGGWFMDRDGFMGNSGTEKDLVYRDLGSDLVAAGFAVVRYDNRGVKCNEMTMLPCPAGSREPEFSKHYLAACVDADVRQTVSVQTQMDDVEVVWNFALNYPQIAPGRLVAWAHSEGGLNVARLIGARRISPLGVIIVGTAMESPTGLVHWQMVDGYAQHLLRWDNDGDGRVTSADIDHYFPTDHVYPSVSITAEMLAPPDGGWTWATARERFSRIYEQTKAAALAMPDDAPYPSPSGELDLVVASQNWWKQWFEDTTPMIDHLADYRGPVSVHIGGIDSQCVGERQRTFAESRIAAGIFARAPLLIFHPERGHALRTREPAAGPMDDEAKAGFIDEIRAFFSA